MSERADLLTDEAIAQFLRARAADAELGLLEDIVRTVGVTPQDRPWSGLRPSPLSPRTLMVASIALLLATIGAMAVGSRFTQPELPSPSSVARPVSCCGGEVVMWVAQPWAEDPGISSGFALNQDRAERLEVFENPLTVATGCGPNDPPADAEAVAAALRSDPAFRVTDPIAVRVGGREGIRMDLTAFVGWDDCDGDSTGRVLEPDDESGSRMRLYLVDAPEGSSIRILAIAIQAPEARLEDVAEAAAPIVDSIDFPLSP